MNFDICSGLKVEGVMEVASGFRLGMGSRGEGKFIGVMLVFCRGVSSSKVFMEDGFFFRELGR